MLRGKNECIAVRGFACLILDYEYEDFVSCRVLIEDLCHDTIIATSREETIEKFREWKRS